MDDGTNVFTEKSYPSTTTCADCSTRVFPSIATSAPFKLRRYSQFLQIIQFADDTLQVSHTVTIGISETFGIDLVGDFIMPPFFCYGHLGTPHFLKSNDLIRYP